MLIGACREWAIENKEFGVWGGTTEKERKRIRRMRKAVKGKNIRQNCPATGGGHKPILGET